MTALDHAGPGASGGPARPSWSPPAPGTVFLGQSRSVSVLQQPQRPPGRTGRYRFPSAPALTVQPTVGRGARSTWTCHRVSPRWTPSSRAPACRRSAFARLPHTCVWAPGDSCCRQSGLGGRVSRYAPPVLSDPAPLVRCLIRLQTRQSFATVLILLVSARTLYETDSQLSITALLNRDGVSRCVLHPVPAHAQANGAKSYTTIKTITITPFSNGVQIRILADGIFNTRTPTPAGRRWHLVPGRAQRDRQELLQRQPVPGVVYPAHHAEGPATASACR